MCAWFIPVWDEAILLQGCYAFIPDWDALMSICQVSSLCTLGNTFVVCRFPSFGGSAGPFDGEFHQNGTRHRMEGGRCDKKSV